MMISSVIIIASIMIETACAAKFGCLAGRRRDVHAVVQIALATACLCQAPPDKVFKFR